nr:MAG TPA: hypothetical protein [Caudoviricetes sp.]
MQHSKTHCGITRNASFCVRHIFQEDRSSHFGYPLPKQRTRPIPFSITAIREKPN